MSLDFTDLPQDIFIEICSYLGVFSVISVSLASPKLNAILNVNRIWKSCYKKSFGNFRNILTSEPNENLCTWKRHSIDKLRLYSKWKNGVCTEEKLPLSGKSFHSVLCDDDIIILAYDSFLDVYDLKTHTFTQRILSALKNKYETPIYWNCISYKQGVLIKVNGDLLQLFKKYGNTIKLEKQILVNDLNVDVPDSRDLTDWFVERRFGRNRLFHRRGYDHDSVHFVYIIRSFSRPTTAVVLNMSNKTKKELILDKMNEMEGSTVVYLNRNIIYFVLNNKGSSFKKTYIKAYDIAKGEIIVNQIFKYHTYVHVTENLIFTISHSDYVQVWDISGNKIRRVPLPNRKFILGEDYGLPKMIFNHPYFLFDIDKVHVIDYQDKSSTLIDRDLNWKAAIAVQPFLFLLPSTDGDRNNIVELWSLLNGRPELVETHLGPLAYATPSGSHLILKFDEKIIIKKFW